MPRGSAARVGLLQQVQEAARVAVGVADQRVDRDVVELQLRAAPRSRARSSSWRSSSSVSDFSTYTWARDSSARVDFERRVLGGRADEGDQAATRRTAAARPAATC